MNKRVAPPLFTLSLKWSVLMHVVSLRPPSWKFPVWSLWSAWGGKDQCWKLNMYLILENKITAALKPWIYMTNFKLKDLGFGLVEPKPRHLSAEKCVVIAAGVFCVHSAHLYNNFLFSLYFLSSRRTKLTAVHASVWYSLARQCKVIGSQITSVAGITSSLSNWFPLWVRDSIWTPAFPIRHRATVCSIASVLLLTSLFCSKCLFYLMHHWSNSVLP